MHFSSNTVFLGLLAGANALIPSPFDNYGVSHTEEKRAASSTFPIAAGTSTLSSPKTISGVFDGKMYRFDRGKSCSDEGEGGDADAVFLVQSGGTVKNVIIGANQLEGIHCLGPCTIQNVWWEDVCEDALSIKQTSGTSYIIGGGAKGASDKVIQHNSGGTVSIKDFYVDDFGKLYRSCGNCKTQYKRTVVADGVRAGKGKMGFGINRNYGDTATITNSCIPSTVKKVCAEFEGNNKGSEPKELSSGPSSFCKYSSGDIDNC